MAPKSRLDEAVALDRRRSSSDAAIGLVGLARLSSVGRNGLLQELEADELLEADERQAVLPKRNFTGAPSVMPIENGSTYIGMASRGATQSVTRNCEVDLDRLAGVPADLVLLAVVVQPADRVAHADLGLAGDAVAGPQAQLEIDRRRVQRRAELDLRREVGQGQRPQHQLARVAGGARLRRGRPRGRVLAEEPRGVGVLVAVVVAADRGRILVELGLAAGAGIGARRFVGEDLGRRGSGQRARQDDDGSTDHGRTIHRSRRAGRWRAGRCVARPHAGVTPSRASGVADPARGLAVPALLAWRGGGTVARHQRGGERGGKRAAEQATPAQKLDPGCAGVEEGSATSPLEGGTGGFMARVPGVAVDEVLELEVEIGRRRRRVARRSRTRRRRRRCRRGPCR
jgi:hypothetical protein